VGYKERSNGSSSIPKSILGDMIAHYGDWKPALYRSRISFFERLVPIIIGQMFRTSDLDFIHLYLVPFTHYPMSLL
jgi:hypothetical protein